MTADKEDKMNSNLNRSFSKFFHAPMDLLPFGKSSEDAALELNDDPEDKIDDRLASRLSTPAGKTRSSRKKRSSKGKSTKGPVEYADISSGSEWSTGTPSTSPNSSSSSFGNNDIQVVERMNQYQMQKETFENIQKQFKSGRRRSVKPAAPPASPEAVRKPKLRRTQSDGASVLEKMRKTKPVSPKTRESTLTSRKSTPGGRSPRRRGGMTDESRKTAHVDSKGAPALPSAKRTSNKSSSRRPSRRPPVREVITTTRSTGSEEEGGTTMKRGSKTGTVVSIPVEPAPRTAAAPMAPPPATTEPEGKWTCECGCELRDRMIFCGMCGTHKHWTCDDCHFDENPCQFAFCGNCGVSREGSSRSNSFFKFDGVKEQED